MDARRFQGGRVDRRRFPPNREPRRDYPQDRGPRTGLRVLVIGGGGREHALVWKIAQSSLVERVYAIPGSAGISEIAQCFDMKLENQKEIVNFAVRNKIDLTVVGPDAAIANGIVDDFAKRNLKIFGPTRKAAELEWSKSFAKRFMRRNHIPTGSYRVYEEPIPAITFCRTAVYPLVLKADGLAAGKGVIIAQDFLEAEWAIRDILVRKVFGKAGKKLVIEEFLEGQELSVMAICDGESCWPLLPVQDHKRIGEGDTGPNTGGMGAYCPVPIVTKELLDEIYERILLPAVTGMAAIDRPYKGILYAGLIITQSGPKVLEFNCRWGDPETQAALPLLESDLVPIIQTVVNHQLKAFAAPKMKERQAVRKGEQDETPQEEEIGPRFLRDFPSDYDPDIEEPANDKRGKIQLKWREGASACVTVASRGYPGKPEIGKRITGLETISSKNCIIFHAGTKKSGGAWTTAGGRVLSVTGLGASLEGALNEAYAAINRIRFQGMRFRRDIGHRAIKSTDITKE